MHNNKHYVFCYGTLKKYNRNHYIMKDALYIGKAYLHNVAMLDLGNYPGLIKGQNSIMGEVYCVDDAKKKELDIFEEVGTLYQDKEAIVSIDKKDYVVHYYERIDDGKTYPLCPDEESYYRVDPNIFTWFVVNDAYLETMFLNYFKENKEEEWLKKEKNAYLVKEEIADFIFKEYTKTFLKTNYDHIKMYIYD